MPSLFFFHFCPTLFIEFQAAEICGCVGIIAEVSYEALKKRHDQGWVKEIFDDVEKLIMRVKEAKKKQEVSLSVAKALVQQDWSRKDA